jgi:hypothetical protein
MDFQGGEKTCPIRCKYEYIHNRNTGWHGLQNVNAKYENNKRRRREGENKNYNARRYINACRLAYRRGQGRDSTIIQRLK